MKICIIGSSGVPIPPKYGGAVERHIFDLARHTTKLGHRVHVLTMKTEEEGQYEEINGVFVHRISKYYEPSNPLKSLWKHAAFFISVLMRMWAFSPDVIHAHNGIPGLAAWIISRLKRIPFIYTSHLSYISIPHAKQKDFLRNLFNTTQVLCDEFCAKHANHVIAVSDFVKRGLLAVGVHDNKITVIPNGVDTNFFMYNAKLAESFKSKYGLVDKKIVTFVGRIVKNKGLSYLVEAASEAVKEIPDVNFVIVGPVLYYGEKKLTDYYKSLLDRVERKGLRPHFTFTGPLVGKDLLAAYSACDCLILPSLSESFGMVLTEAMSCRKVVIGTRLHGIVGLIKDGETGFFIRPYDPKDMVEKLCKVLRSDCSEVGKKARKKVLERFSWEIVAQEIVNVYTYATSR